MITLRPYQDDLYIDILNGIDLYRSVLVQAETGFGKSILIGHLANNLPGRTLILTHRIELLTQNSEWIEDLGILTAQVKKNEPLKLNKNVIAMTQTASARFEKFGFDYIGEFDNVLIDEVHVDFFKRVYSSLNFKKLIGFTATPIIYKKEKKTVSGEEMVRKLSLADDFDTIVQGISVNELIDLGYLTEDKYITLAPPDLSKLRKSSSNPDGFTTNSLTEVFGSYASVKKVIEAYEMKIGTKTIIFNPTTAVNLKTYEAFVKNGWGDRTKLFDSVNKTDESRSDVVNWFKSTPGAILLNVGVFTTGFDVKDIETIIYNKATLSLSLWLQSAGRGGRIFEGKKDFTIIDLGLNVERHGFWSDDRDWKEYFVIDKWKANIPSDILQVWECDKCGEFNLKGTLWDEERKVFVCAECDTPRPKSKSKTKHIEGEFKEVAKTKRYPTSKAIIQYAINNGNDANLAFRLLEKQLLKLILEHTERQHYIENKPRYISRVRELYRPIYFSIIRSDLVGGRKRLETQVQKIIKKIDKHYEQKT